MRLSPPLLHEVFHIFTQAREKMGLKLIVWLEEEFKLIGRKKRQRCHNVLVAEKSFHHLRTFFIAVYISGLDCARAQGINHTENLHMGDVSRKMLQLSP